MHDRRLRLAALSLTVALGASAPACLLDTGPFAAAGNAGPGGGEGGSGGDPTSGPGGDTASGGNQNGGSGPGGDAASGGTGGGHGGSGAGGGGPVAGDACPGLHAELAAYESASFAGDTTHAGDEYGSSVCGGGDAPELVYEVKALAKGTLIAEVVTRDEYDVFIHARKGTCGSSAAEIACKEAAAGEPVAMSLPVDAGDVVYFFVDGHAAQPSGAFDLSVYLNGCGNGFIELAEECDDGNQNDGDTCDRECKVICDKGNHPTTNHVVHKDPDTKHCYLVSFNPDRNWGQSQSDCVAWGGHLAALTTLEEIQKVVPMLTSAGQAMWIGGHDSTTEGSFAWVTNEPWLYTNGQAPWTGSTEPNDFGSGEDCVEMDKSGKLNDESCNDSQNHLCERPPAGTLAMP